MEARDRIRALQLLLAWRSGWWSASYDEERYSIFDCIEHAGQYGYGWRSSQQVLHVDLRTHYFDEDMKYHRYRITVHTRLHNTDCIGLYSC